MDTINRFGVDWQPGPRRHWRKLTWRDLGHRIGPSVDDVFYVPTFDQAVMAADEMQRRGATTRVVGQVVRADAARVVCASCGADLDPEDDVVCHVCGAGQPSPRPQGAPA